MMFIKKYLKGTTDFGCHDATFNKPSKNKDMSILSNKNYVNVKVKMNVNIIFSFTGEANIFNCKIKSLDSSRVFKQRPWNIWFKRILFLNCGFLIQQYFMFRKAFNGFNLTHP